MACASAIISARRTSEAAVGSSWSPAISDSTASAVTTACDCSVVGTSPASSPNRDRASADRPDSYSAWPSADSAQERSVGWAPASSNARRAAARERPTSSNISVARARAAPNASELIPAGGGPL
jgi:hypothetical protein